MYNANMQDYKEQSLEHVHQAVDKGETFWADGCDPRQSVSQS